MKLKYITMVVVVLLAFAFTVSTGAAKTDSQTTSDDIQEYNGPIGSDHALYGWKLALQDLDEAFTLNQSDKLAKKIAHLEERIAEYKAASTKKNEKAAARALKVYEEKSKDLEDSVSEVSDKDKKGLLNAYEMIQKHQKKLDGLRNSDHGEGIEKAYQNSVDLQEKFRIKHDIKDDEEDADDKLIDSIKIKAKITTKGNTTVEIDMKFGSGNYTNETIAQEIRNRFLALDIANITNLTRFENTSAEEKLTQELEATANVRNNSSKVKVEYKFWLNETNETKIIQGIYDNLRSTSNEFMTVNYLKGVLEIKLVDDVEVTASQTEIEKEELKQREENNREKGNENGKD